MDDYNKRAKSWLQGSFDEETKEAVKTMMEHNPKELEESFYKNLEFGTGGLRGIMGVGTNRMNRYTVGMATQGLANYLKICFAHLPQLKVAISYDCRNRSAEFAQITARVFAANGFKVYLFDALRPTPELSFAIRHLGCQSGVMITASHNPKEYNGYKAYWDDGAQVLEPHDRNIIQEVEKISDPSQVLFEGNEHNIEMIGKEMDEIYLQAVLSLINLSPKAIKNHAHLTIVYTPLHGTGVHLVPKALKRLGFTSIEGVPEQNVNDGNFPTVVSPNPEEPAALAMALERAEAVQADLVMATDPDADRLGIAVRDNQGNLKLLNGNQIASLLTYYLLRRWKELGKLTGKEYMIKTIVTTDLIKQMTDAYGVRCYNVLTGFKYIAQVQRSLEGAMTFIGGGEESYGYNVGSFVRDKDAVVSCALAAEAAAWAAEQGKSLFDILIDIYVEFGLFKEHMVSLTKKGKEGLAQIDAMMKRFRSTPPQTLGGAPVVLIHDYQSSETIDLISDLRYQIGLPKSNVLQFITCDNTVVTVRPSGTEPKIKFYFGLRTTLRNKEEYDPASASLDARRKQIEEEL
ncbi:MAG: phospho-sugar mutase, partial [Bacteroidales bacterium]|nr:phospho-sugar mutase [Bacteroidales bacterium]